MVDIDYFKKINETYGHTAGDMVLKTAAEVIRQAVRSYDLIGRYGGEKFVLLIAISDEVEIARIAERIRENVERIYTVYEGDEIKITCSVGVAKLLKNDTVKTVMQKAGEALCVAKNTGRNQVKMHDDKLYN
jgi:diguanylate cyclase (GGDEF)-like protein